MYFVYVLKSRNFDRNYTGHTDNLEKRIEDHNKGKTRSIKAYLPFDLVYFETYKTRSEAVAREKFLKSGAGREFIKEILKNARVVQLDRIPDFGSGG